MQSPDGENYIVRGKIESPKEEERRDPHDLVLRRRRSRRRTHLSGYGTVYTKGKYTSTYLTHSHLASEVNVEKHTHGWDSRIESLIKWIT